jgi:hypothetical protein
MMLTGSTIFAIVTLFGFNPDEITTTICAPHGLADASSVSAVELDVRRRFSIPMKRIPLPIRFWRKVDRTTTPDGCWTWTGCLFNTKKVNRYGEFWFEGRPWLAHRVSWIISFGRIADDILVLHSCDNPPCVRPDHLFLGNNTDNAQDALLKGRLWIPKGIAHGCAKLTEDQVWEIRRLIQEGNLSLKTIGAMFGVTRSNVGYIKSGKLWKSLK